MKLSTKEDDILDSLHKALLKNLYSEARCVVTALNFCKSYAASTDEEAQKYFKELLVRLELLENIADEVRANKVFDRS